MSEPDKRKRYLVWRRMEGDPTQKPHYGASEADTLYFSANITVLITMDRETGERLEEHCLARYSIGGDSIEHKAAAYEILLPWIQDKIDQAIRDNKRAIKEKQHIQIE